MFPYSDADVHHGTFPYVNVVLIGICALVFLYQLSLGGVGFLGGGGGIEARIFFLTWGFIPEELIRGEPYTTFTTGAITRSIETPVPTWVTIFSSMFMHGGFMHFAGNMMFLWVFGDNIEDRLGHVKYLFFYLFTGVVATLAHFAIDPGSQTPLVGASGAISGVLGAYLVLYPFNRVKALVVLYIITVIEVRAVILLGLWFGWQLFQGLISLGLSSQVNVAFFAHIGGFAAGSLIMAALKMASGEPLKPVNPRRAYED